MDKNPKSLAYQQDGIDGSLTVSLLKQTVARLRNTVYDGQHTVVQFLMNIGSRHSFPLLD